MPASMHVRTIGSNFSANPQDRLHGDGGVGILTRAPTAAPRDLSYSLPLRRCHGWNPG